MEQPTAPPPAASTGMRVLGWLGLIGHVLVGLFPYSVSTLMAPPTVYIVLLPVWLLLLWVAIRNLRARPIVTFLVPIVAVLVWFAVMSAGDVFLGWTA